VARIFWVKCPRCGQRFYASRDDFRLQADRRLRCPFCGARFTDAEAAELADG
jgi:DNA-directed RNA polymerase subunit RPC12/RpoP